MQGHQPGRVRSSHPVPATNVHNLANVRSFPSHDKPATLTPSMRPTLPQVGAIKGLHHLADASSLTSGLASCGKDGELHHSARDLASSFSHSGSRQEYYFPPQVRLPRGRWGHPHSTYLWLAGLRTSEGTHSHSVHRTRLARAPGVCGTLGGLASSERPGMSLFGRKVTIRKR